MNIYGLECEENDGKWHFIKYGFGRIKYFRRKI